MQPIVIAELARMPLASKIKPASARIGVLRVRCTVGEGFALQFYFSNVNQGDKNVR